MEINKFVVTGKPFFISRYQGLFKALSSYFDSLECIETGDIYSSKIIRKIMKSFYCISNGLSFDEADNFYKNDRAFIQASKQTENKIKQLKYTPDFVFHIFSTCCPFWEKSNIPYAMYLDYTMALAVKNYKPWNPFETHQEFLDWFEYEQRAYKRAKYLFTMSSSSKIFPY